MLILNTGPNGSEPYVYSGTKTLNVKYFLDVCGRTDIINLRLERLQNDNDQLKGMRIAFI